MAGKLKKIILALVILVIVGGAFIIFRSESIVRDAVETYGPEYLEASVTLENVGISFLNGEASLEILVIGNPEGFQCPRAFTVHEISVDLELASIFSDVLKIREIRIEEPELTIELKKGGNNIEVLQRNLDRYQEDEESVTLVTVEDLYINGTKVNVDGLPVTTSTHSITLPDIHIQDIGVDEGGTTFDVIFSEIFAQIVPQAMKALASDDLKNMVSGILDKSGEDQGTLGKLVDKGLDFFKKKDEGETQTEKETFSCSG